MKNLHSTTLLIIILFTYSISVKGQSNIYVSLNNTKEIYVDEENYISSVDAGAVFALNNYFCVGGGVTVAKVWNTTYSSIGTGLGPDVQIYLNKNSRLRFFLEGKGRVMYLFPEYPQYALNYAFWGGPSLEFALSEKYKLKFGICYNHLSNAKKAEQIKNSSLDGLGFNIGLAFY